MSDNTITPKREVVYELGHHDVLLGRGRRAYNHEGNIRFREFVKEAAATYMANESKSFRRTTACKIIAKVEQNGGRFLEQEQGANKNGRQGQASWRLVQKAFVVTKVKQALRDMATSLLKSAIPCESKNRLSTKCSAKKASLRSRSSEHLQGGPTRTTASPRVTGLTIPQTYLPLTQSSPISFLPELSHAGRDFLRTAPLDLMRDARQLDRLQARFHILESQRRVELLTLLMQHETGVPRLGAAPAAMPRDASTRRSSLSGPKGL